MEESFSRKLKEYFSFMKKDRTGILVLMVLIMIVIAGQYLAGKILVKPTADITEMIREFEEWERQKSSLLKERSLFYFDPNTVTADQLDSLKLPEFIKRNILGYRNAGGSFNSSADLRKIYGMNDSIFNEVQRWLIFPEKVLQEVKESKTSPGICEPIAFDPNTAGGDVLEKVGFNRFQASNMIKYREKGGRFHSPEDILKIYGVDTGLYMSVAEHIRINETIGKSDEKKESLELNNADSLLLVKLPGIGPVLAARIIKYRNLLGGFYSVEQIREVYGLPEETFLQLKDKLETDTMRLKKISVNFADYAELIRHPYLEKNHVEAILDFRQTHGPFDVREQLLKDGILDTLSFARLKPYITCR